LRAKPEQTQLVDLSDASFLGKLLVLPAKVRPDWKVFARYKHYLAASSATKKKSFITTDTKTTSLFLRFRTGFVAFSWPFEPFRQSPVRFSAVEEPGGAPFAGWGSGWSGRDGCRGKK
jgi:hypothetical protein